MLFLIEYERQVGKVRSMKSFPESAVNEAQDARLRLELNLRRCGIDHEVVLLEAADESALYLTHARYFKSFDTLATGTSS